MEPNYFNMPKPNECGDAGNNAAPCGEVRFKMYTDKKRIKEVDEK